MKIIVGCSLNQNMHEKMNRWVKSNYQSNVFIAFIASGSIKFQDKVLNPVFVRLDAILSTYGVR